MNAAATTLGLLAGGRATRLGGIDKAWLERGGVAQVLRLADRLRGEVDAVLASANRDHGRYAAHGMAVVSDRFAGIGPLGGIDALAHACATPWLLTLPVDLLSVNDCLLRSLRAAGAGGAFAEDDDGVQPLVALWHVASLRDALPATIASGAHAVHELQAGLGMACVRFEGVRFGNLNTPAELAVAGMAGSR